MKNRTLFLYVLSMMLALAAGPASSADVPAQVPRTAAAQGAGDLISRAERVIIDFLAACTRQDAQALHRVTTHDARIEYTLDAPGTYLGMDASSLIAEGAAKTPAGNSESHVSNLWIFPTGDVNAVFVQYDASAGSAGTMTHRQLALIEMRGDRISRFLSFAAAPPYVFASTAPAD